MSFSGGCEGGLPDDGRPLRAPTAADVTGRARRIPWPPQPGEAEDPVD
ncbi:hypothetical protein ACTWQF_21810 [Streptomyces sp. 8N114]